MAYERLVRPLTEAERDAYCAEAFPIAVALLARATRTYRRRGRTCARYLDRMYASKRSSSGRRDAELARAVLSPVRRLARRSCHLDQPDRSRSACCPADASSSTDCRGTRGIERTFTADSPSLRTMRRRAPGCDRAVARVPNRQSPVSGPDLRSSIRKRSSDPDRRSSATADGSSDPPCSFVWQIPLPTAR